MTDKVELKSCHEVIDTVDVVNIESIFCGKPTDPDILTVIMKDGKRLYCDEVCPMQEEPVSEELEEAANNALNNVLNTHEIVNVRSCLEMFRFGANWKKEQMMAKAIDVKVKVDAGGYPYIPQMELYDYDNDIPLAKEGDKYKVVLIKEE